MSDLALYRRLLRQARPYWLHLAVLFCIGLLASPVALLNPVPLKIVVDSVLGTRPLSPALQALLPAAIAGSRAALLAVAVGLLLAVAALGQLQSLANKFMQAYVGERLVLGFRTQLVQQAQRLSLSYHDSKGAADSLYRIQQDASVIDKIMVEGVIPFITAAITLGTMIVVTANLDWQLALVALTASPPLVALSRRATRSPGCPGGSTRGRSSVRAACSSSVAWRASMTRTGRCCTTSPSWSSRGRGSASWGRPGRGRRRSSAC